ncbi:unnamed protein product [Coffea canephora]|uniref:DH200=94 genomic scaffold, scaffold_426 n=1 Tax=Coffea canephora TaxID=49390 RepID=A0A068VFF4_COFCA|nr:unnamed protein product [Coffea canephora]
MATEIEKELEKLAVEEGKEVEEKEKKIPVFTVLKNNSILKNIFLIDTPPDSLLPTAASSSSTTWMIPKDEKQEEGLLEEILVVGRHPDCNITVEHPSISRFHLRIHSIPSLESLSVIDLSSVHGTWVSGKKIEAGVQVKLNEGDTLRLGGSTRVYRLHWVPLSHAYDMKNPFVPPLDELEPVEQRAEQKPMHQDEDGLYPQDDQSYCVGDYFEGLDLLFADMNMISSIKQLTPSETVIMREEDIKPTFPFENDAENKIEIAEMQPVWQFDKEDSIRKVCLASASHEEDPNSRPVTSQRRSGMSIWERRGKSASVHIETGRDREDCIEANADLTIQFENNENIRNGSPSQDLFTAADWSEEIFTSDKENHTPDILLNRPLKAMDLGKVKHQFSVDSLLSSLDDHVEEAFTPDKENMTPKTHLFKSMKRLGKLEEINHLKSYRSSPLKNAGSIKHERLDMLVLSDDRNQVSNLLREKKSANPAPRSLARSKAAILKVREDRVPFQSLLVNSSKTKSEASDPAGRIGSSTSGKNPQMTEATHSFLNSSEENRTWTMVVDTACLLDKESRKALQLMQGLQGTSLIIPRIVIRELDSMKRHSTLFKRTAGADSALQWIEESMVKAKWWIHVQSSLEDARPIAPTPRSIPLSESNEEKEKFSIGSIPYAPFGSLLDIVSPTTEDHVLECALFFRKIGNNGQLILLSNDVTLKIKAMAEGLRCETAEEFRESLVNPFSERFLWTASSPRGPTWSCLDDVVLREKYYNGPSRKQSKLEPAKGLKLILLHNSQYKQISSVS